MRLIHTSSLLVEEFYGNDIPQYAILSHTWEKNEVAFQEFKTGNAGFVRELGLCEPDPTSYPQAWHKIAATCAQARRDNLDYAWVDTCCIDKTSSAELTEAINSMFEWYRRAQVCYVYLADFTLDPTIEPSSEIFEAAFRKCRWFTRGWCLQELLAPHDLRFFNQAWQSIGTKTSLQRLISAITEIPEPVLSIPAYPKKGIMKQFPIAARISWIARRQTTRIEDMSYSLLGIVDVRMPMLYGEGHKAFLRLQEEIIRKHNDLSLFAWARPGSPLRFMPVLAFSTSNFFASPSDASRTAVGSRLGDRLTTQFGLTNQGVSFPSAKLRYRRAQPGFRHQYLMFVNYATHPGTPTRDSSRYIVLQKVGPGIFVRLQPDDGRPLPARLASTAFFENICVLDRLPPHVLRQLTLWERYAVRLRWKPWPKPDTNNKARFWHVRSAQPRASWDLAANQFLTEMAQDRHMHIEFVPGTYETNPRFEHFVIVIQVGNGERRDTREVSARIVSAEEWRSLNTTMMGFEGKEALVLEAMRNRGATQGGDRIEIAGCEIRITIRMVREEGEEPYHLVYLDWGELREPPTPE